MNQITSKKSLRPVREVGALRERFDRCFELSHVILTFAVPEKRFADEDVAEEWDWNPSVLGQRLAEAVEEDRDDRHVRMAFGEVGDAVLERRHGFGFAAGTFWIDDQY